MAWLDKGLGVAGMAVEKATLESKGDEEVPRGASEGDGGSEKSNDEARESDDARTIEPRALNNRDARGLGEVVALDDVSTAVTEKGAKRSPRSAQQSASAVRPWQSCASKICAIHSEGGDHTWARNLASEKHAKKACEWRLWGGVDRRIRRACIPAVAHRMREAPRTLPPMAEIASEPCSLDQECPPIGSEKTLQHEKYVKYK